ncbi:MAG: hypothetical protein ABI835_20345 [Chloroflexota bacterium]
MIYYHIPDHSLPNLTIGQFVEQQLRFDKTLNENAPVLAQVSQLALAHTDWFWRTSGQAQDHNPRHLPLEGVRFDDRSAKLWLLQDDDPQGAILFFLMPMSMPVQES